MADVATIAVGIAAYGAGLATYREVVQHRDRKRSFERDVSVEGRMRPKNGDALHPVQIVRAINRKTRSIEIARAGLEFANGMLVWQPPDSKLPARLGDGESVEVELADSWIELTSGMVPYEPVALAVQDSHGAVYRSGRVLGR